MTLLVGLVFAAMSGIAYSQAPDPEMMKRIEGPLVPGAGDDTGMTIPQMMAHYKVPGLIICVFKDYEIAWVKTYGVKNMETKEPITADTLFQTGSISKCVTAVATMKAVENGLFSLDDPINSILTSWQLPDNDHTYRQAVTPRMLLSHTGGVNVGHIEGYPHNVFLPTTLQILDGMRRANTAKVRVVHEPLTKYSYSSGGMVIMGLALGDAVGKDFPEVVKEYIFDPAGMKNSTYHQPLDPDEEKKAATGHDQFGQLMEDKYRLYPELAAGGLWSTAPDMALMAIDIQKTVRDGTGNILNEESAEEILKRTGFGIHGLGFTIWERGGRSFFGHQLNSKGYDGMLTADRDDGYGVVLMMNSDSGRFLYKPVAARIFKEYDWKGY